MPANKHLSIFRRCNPWTSETKAIYSLFH